MGATLAESLYAPVQKGRGLSFAEVILRMGVSIVCWMLIYAHSLMLAVIPVADCTPEDDTLWRGVMIVGILTLVASAVLHVGLNWRSTLRWLSLPALPLWLYAAYVCIGYLEPVSLQAIPLCEAKLGIVSESSAAMWQRLWAPLHLLVIISCAVQALRYWRSADET